MAMAHLVNLRGPRLMAHCMRLLQDKEEARDAVQDTWYEIIRSLKNLRDPRAFPAWAIRIATRRCATIIKKKQNQRKISKAVVVECEDYFEETNTDMIEIMRLRRAIAQLPPAQSAAIALFYLDEMSVAETAVALDVPVGTIKTRLMHARAKLKEILEGEYDDE